MNKEECEKHLILKCYAGSITYGTNTRDSDVDIRGIVIPPKEYWLGLSSFEQYVSKDDEFDITYFGIKKFFNLALNANPNILELLFLRENHYLWKDTPYKKLGMRLIENRHIFLSKKCRHSFMGYAYAQFRRMDKLNKNVGQNQKRKDSFEKFGYDTKNALHLLRLARQAIEILTEGELYVFRHDAQQLLDVKEGKYTYDELVEQFEHYERLVEEAYVHSPLPHKPDYDKANELLIELVEEYFEEELRRRYID